MKLLGRSKLIRVAALVLAVIFGSQQVGWADYIDLRDGAGFEDYALAVAAGAFSSYSMNPSWNVVQMFAYTYLIPLAADKITEDIENPYLRAATSAFISAAAVGALDGAFTSDKIADRSSQAISNAERATATTAQSAAQQAAANAAKDTVTKVTKETMKGALIKGALTTGLAHAAAAVVGEYADQHGWGKGWGFLAKVVVAQAVQGAAESAFGVKQVATKDGPAYVKADQGGILEGAWLKLTDEHFLNRLKVEVARVTIEELAVRAGMDEDLVTAVGAGLSRVYSYKLTKAQMIKDRKEELEELGRSPEQDSVEVRNAMQKLNEEIQQLETGKGTSDLGLFLQGVRIGLVSAGLQYLSRQTKSPLHGAVFLAGASALLQGAVIHGDLLIKKDVSDEKREDLSNLYAQKDAEAARDTRLNQIYNSDEQDGEVRNELHTLQTEPDATTALLKGGSLNIEAEVSPEKKGIWLYLDLLQDTITSANADFYSFGRATYRPQDAGDKRNQTFEFAWQSGNDAFFAARYTDYQKTIRDKGFVTALAYQLASSYFYQAVRNVDSVVSGDINRHVYMHDKTQNLQDRRQEFLYKQSRAQLDKLLKDSQLIDKILGVDGLSGIKEGLKKAQEELNKQYQAPDQDYNEVRNKIHELLEIRGELYKKQGELEQELKDLDYTSETTPKKLIERLKVKIEDLKAQIEKAGADKLDDKALKEKLRGYELKKQALAALVQYEKAGSYQTQVRNKYITGLIKDYLLVTALWVIPADKIWDSSSDNVPAPGSLIPLLAARGDETKEIIQSDEATVAKVVAALNASGDKEYQERLTNTLLNEKLAYEALIESRENGGVSETRVLKAAYGDIYNFDYYGGIEGFKARYGDKVLVSETIPEDLKQAYREEQQSRAATVLLPAYIEQVKTDKEESIRAEITDINPGLSKKEIEKLVNAEIYKWASALANQKAAEYITSTQGELSGLEVLAHLNGIEYSHGVYKFPSSSTPSANPQVGNVPVTAPDDSDDFDAYLRSKHPPEADNSAVPESLPAQPVIKDTLPNDIPEPTWERLAIPSDAPETTQEPPAATSSAAPRSLPAQPVKKDIIPNYIPELTREPPAIPPAAPTEPPIPVVDTPAPTVSELLSGSVPAPSEITPVYVTPPADPNDVTVTIPKGYRQTADVETRSPGEIVTPPADPNDVTATIPKGYTDNPAPQPAVPPVPVAAIDSTDDFDAYLRSKHQEELVPVGTPAAVTPTQPVGEITPTYVTPPADPNDVTVTMPKVIPATPESSYLRSKPQVPLSVSPPAAAPAQLAVPEPLDFNAYLESKHQELEPASQVETASSALPEPAPTKGESVQSVTYDPAAVEAAKIGGATSGTADFKTLTTLAERWLGEPLDATLPEQQPESASPTEPMDKSETATSAVEPVFPLPAQVKDRPAASEPGRLQQYQSRMDEIYTIDTDLPDAKQEPIDVSQVPYLNVPSGEKLTQMLAILRDSGEKDPLASINRGSESGENISPNDMTAMLINVIRDSYYEDKSSNSNLPFEAASALKRIYSLYPEAQEYLDRVWPMQGENDRVISSDRVSKLQDFLADVFSASDEAAQRASAVPIHYYAASLDNLPGDFKDDYLVGSNVLEKIRGGDPGSQYYLPESAYGLPRPDNSEGEETREKIEIFQGKDTLDSFAAEYSHALLQNEFETGTPSRLVHESVDMAGRYATAQLRGDPEEIEGVIRERAQDYKNNQEIFPNSNNDNEDPYNSAAYAVTPLLDKGYNPLQVGQIVYQTAIEQPNISNPEDLKESFVESGKRLFKEYNSSPLEHLFDIFRNKK